MVKGEVRDIDIRKAAKWSKITLVVIALIILAIGYLINIIARKQFASYKKRKAQYVLE